MKKFSFLLTIALFATALTVFAAPAGTAETISGKWALALETPNGTMAVELDLKQEGEAVTGSLTSEHASGKIGKGTFKDKKLNATATVDIQGNTTDVTIEGTVDGDKMSGSFNVPGMGSFPYSGGKSK